MKLVYLTLVAVILGVYMNWPQPPLPTSLIKWREDGKYLHYHSHRIFYRDEMGSSQKETLVCLHGFPSSSYDWIKVLPDLKMRFNRIIMLDFLGFGLSDKPTDTFYSLQKQADIVEELLHHLDMQSIHILAHDYGDTVAQELVYRYNKRVSGDLKCASKCWKLQSVLLLNGGMFPETNFPTPIQKLLVVPYLGDFFTRLTCFPIFKYGFGRVFGPNTKPTEEEMLGFWMMNSNNEGHKVTNKLLVYMSERWNYRDRWVGALQETNVPVHTIYGPADVVNPPTPFIEFYRKTLPNAGLTVLNQDIGHYPQWEDPSAVTKHYFAFLDKP